MLVDAVNEPSVLLPYVNNCHICVWKKKICLKKAISLKTSKIKIWQLEPQFLRSSISAFNMMKRYKAARIGQTTHHLHQRQLRNWTISEEGNAGQHDAFKCGSSFRSPVGKGLEFDVSPQILALLTDDQWQNSPLDTNSRLYRKIAVGIFSYRADMDFITSRTFFFYGHK